MKEINHHSNYLILQCQNKNCMMRFPAPENSGIGEQCPVCKTSTKIIRRLVLSNENNFPSAKIDLPEFEVILDNIRSTFNVGAIFRTSDGAGISKVHLCGITPPPTHHKVHKTALGAETRIAYEKHPNTLELVQKLKEAGKRIWALEKTDASIPINQVKLEINDPETVLVVGNEVIGIDPDVLEICDCQVHIPMAGIKNSLNVAVAFGIAVYNLVDKYNFLENTSIN